MKQIWLFFIPVLVFNCLATAADDDPQTHVWTISPQLKGTASQLQHMVNGSVEDAWARLDEARQALALKQQQIESESAVIIKSVHATRAYLDKLAEQKRAEAALAQARQGGDINTALDEGSKVNLARQDIKKMEDTAMRADAQLSQSKEFAADYSRKVTDAEAAFKKTANWRSRIVHSVRYGCTLGWPILDGENCCFNYARVVTAKAGEVEIESEAEELIPGTEQKNARGDGIGIATYHVHPIHVLLATPAGVTPSAGAVIPIKGAYRIVGSPDLSGDVPVYRAQLDPDGLFGVLLHDLNTVKGPPQAVLDKIDDEVDLSEAKAIEEMNKKSF